MENTKFFQWTNEYSVGVQEMDEQHQEFLRLANAVITYVKECQMLKSDTSVLFEIVAELNDYALFHLGSEEKYFSQFNCKNIGKHLKAHAAFRKTINEYWNKTKDYLLGHKNDREGLCRIANEMAKFTGNWLLEHILVMDKGYTSCFHQHGKH